MKVNIFALLIAFLLQTINTENFSGILTVTKKQDVVSPQNCLVSEGCPLNNFHTLHLLSGFTFIPEISSCWLKNPFLFLTRPQSYFCLLCLVALFRCYFCLLFLLLLLLLLFLFLFTFPCPCHVCT